MSGKNNDTFQITVSASVKLDGERLEILLLDRVAGEFLSQEMAFELTSEGQKEPAMERAWTKSFQAEGRASTEAGAVGKGGMED